MATFDMSKSTVGYDLTEFGTLFKDPGVDYAPAVFSNQTASGYVYKNGSANGSFYYGTTFGGTGFTYGATGRPVSGTVSSLTQVVHNGATDTTLLTITGASANILDLYASTDGFIPSVFAGNDTITGSAFDDILFGGAGNDIMNGGAGNDVVSYRGQFSQSGTFVSGVKVDLKLGTGTITNTQGTVTTTEFDTLISIESVIGTNAQDSRTVTQFGTGGDVLLGSAGANKMWGMDGNDTLDGREGDDILNGGFGDDILIGGTGNDTADYSTFADYVATNQQGAIVDLVAGQSWGAFGHDLLTSIENVNGSAGNDWISGSNGANVLSGGLGADVIFGLGGNDIIDGGAGNDALYGGTGNDTITSGTGNDYVEGGDGNDILIDASGSGTPGEWSALHGGNGDDTIQSTGLGDIGMWGDAGNDTFLFGAGHAYVYGGAGADIFGFGQDALASSGTNIAQIYDYQTGVDKIRVNGTFSVEDWGVNTGVLITTSAGIHETIMLMGVTKTQLDATIWLAA
jgi:Ca2+-binding RTX toxin-like protein